VEACPQALDADALGLDAKLLAEAIFVNYLTLDALK